MPGICGIVQWSSTQSVSDLLSEMLESMRHHPWQTIERRGHDEREVAFGRVSLGIVNAEPQPVYDAKTSSLAVMDGELYNVDDRIGANSNPRAMRSSPTATRKSCCAATWPKESSFSIG